MFLCDDSATQVFVRCLETCYHRLQVRMLAQTPLFSWKTWKIHKIDPQNPLKGVQTVLLRHPRLLMGTTCLPSISLWGLLKLEIWRLQNSRRNPLISHQKNRISALTARNSTKTCFWGLRVHRPVLLDSTTGCESLSTHTILFRS